MKNNILSMALLLSSAALLANAGFGQQYEVIDLNTGAATSVSEGGWVAGNDSAGHAYQWQESSNGYFDLNNFTSLSWTNARSINAFGQTLFNGRQTPNGAPEAWIYTPGGGNAQPLSYGGNAGGWGNCILDSGLIAGNINPVDNSYSYGAIWNSPTSAPTIISGANVFASVNSARDFVGTQDSSTPFTHNACLYRDTTNTLISMPTYNGLGDSGPYAINEGGWIVGYSGGNAAFWNETTSGSGVFQAELMEGLDAVGQHGRAAYDNNDWGMAVGFLQSTRSAHNGSYQAFVYSNAYPAGNQMRHLEDFIVSGPTVDFEFANSIDERGWIVGSGRVWNGSYWESNRSLVAKPLLSLMPPTPGVAGTTNELVSFGAKPNALIHLAYSLDPNGTTSLNRWCPGLYLDIAGAQLAAQATSNSNGKLSFQAMVPSKVSGRTVYVQAVDIANCEKSNLVGHTFL